MLNELCHLDVLMVLLNIEHGRSHGIIISSLSKSKCFSAKPECLSDTETCVVACRYTPQMTASTVINTEGWHATLFTPAQLCMHACVITQVCSIHPSVHPFIRPSIRPSRVMGCPGLYPNIHRMTGTSTPQIGAPTHH